MFINGWFLFLTVIYTFVVSKATEFFCCIKEADGTYTLIAAPSYTCYDAQWNRYLPLAVLCTIIYGLGIPALFAALLYHYRRKMRAQDAFITDRFGSLFTLFRRRWYYWELWIFARKAGMIIARSVPFPIYQTIVGIFVLFFTLLMQVFSRPHKIPLNNRLEFTSVSKRTSYTFGLQLQDLCTSHHLVFWTFVLFR
jgi:hypothetical protein